MTARDVGADVANRGRLLVIVRHGESAYNAANRFTGWIESPLTDQGRDEARRAGRLIVEANIRVDKVYTSVLQRTIESAALIMGELGPPRPTVIETWRLNERHYGALQGLDKEAAERRFGGEQVQIWRRSYATRPPAGPSRQVRNDVGTLRVPSEFWPEAESLADVVARVAPFWEHQVRPEVANGLHVLIVAHGNSLRALVKHLETISDAAIESIDVPTGQPIVYVFDTEMRICDRITFDRGHGNGMGWATRR